MAPGEARGFKEHKLGVQLTEFFQRSPVGAAMELQKHWLGLCPTETSQTEPSAALTAPC